MRKLLEKQLNAAQPVLPTAFENVPYSPAQGRPWQRVNLLAARTENPTMGDGFKREAGIFQVSLFYPVNEGPAPASNRAEIVRMLFPRGLSLAEGSVLVRVPEHPYLGPSIPGDGWYMIPVSIPYIADVG